MGFGDNCPLQDQCLTRNLIYRADVEDNTNKARKIYRNIFQSAVCKSQPRF